MAHIDQAIELDGKRSDLRIMRGQILTASGRMSDAIKELNQVLSAEPVNTEALFTRGCSLQRLQDYPRSIADFSEVLKKNEHVTECNIALASLYCKTGNLEESLQYGRKALELAPSNGLALWTVGQIYLEKNDFNQAIQYFNEAKKADRTLPLEADSGRCLFKLGRYEEAVRDLSTVLSINASELQSRNFRALSYQALGELSLAIDDLAFALNSEKDNPEYKANMKSICTKLAERSRQKIAVEPQNAKAHADLAVALYNMNDYVGALDSAKTAILLAPRDSRNYRVAGESQLAAKEYKESEKYFLQALSLNPQDKVSRFELARTQSSQGKYRESVKNYDALIAARYDLRGSLYNRSINYKCLFEYQKAINDLQNALKLTPRDAAIYAGLGDCYFLLGKNDNAANCYKTAIALNPRAESNYTGLSEVLCQIGDYTQALQTLDLIKNVRPNLKSAALEMQRARILCLKGQFKDALKARQIAIELAPEGFAGSRATVALCAGDKTGLRQDCELIENELVKSAPEYNDLLVYLFRNYLGEGETASKIIKASASRIRTEDWPAPVIRYCAGQFSADDLLNRYTSNPNADQTELHAYIGFQEYFSGNLKNARDQLNWVRVNGIRTYQEYLITMSIMRQNNWVSK